MAQKPSSRLLTGERRWIGIFAFTLALFLLAAGCARQFPPSLSRRSSPSAQGLAVTLVLSPQPPRALDPTTFLVRVTDAQNVPVQGARVSVDLSMPGMAMPRSTVACASHTPGSYTGTGRFTMPGAWLVTATVVFGHTHARQAVSVDVK